MNSRGSVPFFCSSVGRFVRDIMMFVGPLEASVGRLSLMMRVKVWTGALWLPSVGAIERFDVCLSRLNDDNILGFSVTWKIVVAHVNILVSRPVIV